MPVLIVTLIVLASLTCGMLDMLGRYWVAFAVRLVIAALCVVLPGSIGVTLTVLVVAGFVAPGIIAYVGRRITGRPPVGLLASARR